MTVFIEMDKEQPLYSNSPIAVEIRLTDEILHRTLASGLNGISQPSTSSCQPEVIVKCPDPDKAAMAVQAAIIRKEIAFGDKMLSGILAAQSRQTLISSLAYLQPNLFAPLLDTFRTLTPLMDSSMSKSQQESTDSTKLLQSEQNSDTEAKQNASFPRLQSHSESGSSFGNPRNSKNKLGRSYNPGRPLSMQDRQQILQLYQHGFKVSHIAKIIGVTHSCVSKIMSRYHKTGSMRPRSGQPLLLSRQEQQRQMHCHFLLKPIPSPSDSSVSSSSSPIPLASLRASLSPMPMEFIDTAAINRCMHSHSLA